MNLANGRLSLALELQNFKIKIKEKFSNSKTIFVSLFIGSNKTEKFKKSLSQSCVFLSGRTEARVLSECTQTLAAVRALVLRRIQEPFAPLQPTVDSTSN